MTQEYARYIQHDRFLEFFGIAEKIAGNHDQRPIADRIFECLRPILGDTKVEYAYLYSNGGEGNQQEKRLDLVGETEIPRTTLDKRVSALRAGLDDIVKTGAMILTNSPQRCVQILKNAFSNETCFLKSLIAVPIRYGTEVVGVLGIGSGKGDVYQSEDLFALEIIGKYLWTAIKHRELFSLSIQSAEIIPKRIILAATYLAEAKDKVTVGHITSVGQLATLVAKEMGYSTEEARKMGYAAMIHDTGKIAMPTYLLLKPGELTQDERDKIRTHAEIGSQLVASVGAPELELARQVALYHHERYNGTGYPHKLSGEQIPLAARITGLVDTFDAMTDAMRPYNRGRVETRQAAAAFITAQSGVLFDPDVVRAFSSIRGRVEDVYVNPVPSYRATMLNA